MSNEYRIEESNGKWYVSQFDVCKRLTAHAKLDNIRQLMLWIEEQENFYKYADDNGVCDQSDCDDDSRDIKWYRISCSHVIP